MAAAERQLGFRIHPLHARLLSEVGNGGFGPGCGLIGVEARGFRANALPILGLRTDLGLCIDLAPLCDWGCGAWSLIDSRTGKVLTLDERGLFDTGTMLREWLETWLAGTDMDAATFVPGRECVGINPFTGQPHTFRSRGRPRGAVIRSTIAVLFERLRELPFPTLGYETAELPSYDGALAGLAQRASDGAPITPSEVPEPAPEIAATMARLRTSHLRSPAEDELLRYYDLLQEIAATLRIG